MNEGRSYFPSTITETLIDQMRLNQARPITSYNQNEVIKSHGDVAISNPNQPVQGGVVLSNLQVNGPTRQPTVVHGKPKIMLKYENKRIDGPVQEGLFNWRTNKSQSGYEYNQIQNSLSDRAKNKVFNAPSYNYLVQPNRVDSKDKGTAAGIPMPYYFDNVSIGDVKQSFNNPYVQSVPKARFQDNFEEGTIQVNMKSETGGQGFGALLQQQMKTNPLLHGNFTGKSMITGLKHGEQGNTPYAIQRDNSLNYGTAYPDERMTRYGGERPYTTRGDRELAARELATSAANQEKRQLQTVANHALQGIARAPRKNVANMSQGVNDDYQDVTVITNGGVEQFDIERNGRFANAVQNEQYVSRDTLVNRSVLLNPQHGESRIGKYSNDVVNPMYPQGSFANRSDKIDRLAMVQPQSRLNTQQVFEEVQRNTYEDDVMRKIYEDDGPRLFQQSKVDRASGFDELDRTRINENFITEESKQQVDKRTLSFTSKLYNGIKSLFGIDPRRKDDSSGRDQLSDQRIVDENSKQITQTQINNTSGTDAVFETYKSGKLGYWVVENGRVKNIVQDFKDEHRSTRAPLCTKPVGILVSEEEIKTTSLIKNGDRIKIIHKVVDEDGTTYMSINVSKAEFEKLLDHPIRVVDKTKQQQVASMKNIKEDICELSFEDYVKVQKIIEQTPGVMKLTSKAPLTEYHRELLDENNLPFLTNSKQLAEENSMQKTFVDRSKMLEQSQRTDMNAQQVDRFAARPNGERFHQTDLNNGVVNNGTIRDQTQPTAFSISKNKTKIMSKFNGMM